MTLETGIRLGHYRIVGVLGRGGMADVYRAEDERLGREVALKAVPSEFARDAERVARFEREVRAAAKFTHPNIVTVYEFGQGDGQHFYTMALMSGGDLKARIRAHPDGMPPSEARAVCAAMARALDYAHRRDYVHRDVKPGNILFDEDGTAHLADFGIARALSAGARETATGMIIGSPHYMSPEQAQDRAVDGRSDQYSLGVVLYEMLTGRVPFDADDTMAVAYSHVNDPAPSLPPSLAAWQPLMDRLLAKSPEERYDSAGELAEELASDGPARPSATRVVPPPTRVMAVAGHVDPATDVDPATALEGPTPPPAAARSRRGMLAAVAVAVLALAAAGVLSVVLRGPDDPEPGGSGAETSTTLPSDVTRPPGIDPSEPAPAEPAAAPGGDSPSLWSGVLAARGEVPVTSPESPEPASGGGRRGGPEGPETPPVEPPEATVPRPLESPSGEADGVSDGDGPTVAAPAVAPPSPAGETRIAAALPAVAPPSPAGEARIAAALPAVAPPSPAGETRIAAALPAAALPSPAGEARIAPALTAGAKALYYAGETPGPGASAAAPPAAAPNAGMKYRILRSGPDGVPVEVDPDTVFRAGDRIRFVFEPNIDGFLFLVQQGSSGRWSVLLPHPQIDGGRNAVARFSEVAVPREGWFMFDENPGSERVFIYLSRQPTAMPWGGGPVAIAQTVDQTTVVELKRRVRSRDLVFEKEDAPGGEERAAYVVNQGAAGNAVAWTFELRHR